jgi:hypothetical protein
MTVEAGGGEELHTGDEVLEEDSSTGRGLGREGLSGRRSLGMS